MNNKYNRDKDYYINEKDKPSERQMSAENYLKEYNIQEILTEMINYLLHKKSKSPIVAMIKYLGGLLTEKEREDNNISIPDPQIDYHPIVEPPQFKSDCNSLLKEYLTDEIFSNLMTKISKYGINMRDLIRLNKEFPKNNIGIMLGDADSLKKFEQLYKPIICKAHNLDINDLKDYTPNNFNLTNLEFKDIKKINIEDIKGLNKITFSISRNLVDSPFVCFLNIENRTEKIVKQLKEIERVKNIQNLKKKEKLNKKDLMDLLRKINYDIDFWDAVNPNEYLIRKQRNIYQSSNDEIIILINFCDNFQIIENLSLEEKNNQENNKENKDNQNKKTLNDMFIESFNNFNDLIRNVQYYYGFEFDHNFGYLTSNIALLGRGFSITTEIDLDKLCENKFDEDKIKEKLKKFDKYTDTYSLDKNENDDNILVFTSSPKISKESMSEFFVEYFEKIIKLKKD